MNKEIYKAKTRSNDEWVYGIPFNNLMLNNDYDCAFDNYEEDLTKKFGWVDDYFYIIKPETICKCSGLKDKNGNKIFEGDIIKHLGDGGTDIVVFVDGKFTGKSGGYSLSETAMYNFEVIGNRWEKEFANESNEKI